jgi:hypothetical protein
MHSRYARRQTCGLPVEKELKLLFNCVDYTTIPILTYFSGFA